MTKRTKTKPKATVNCIKELLIKVCVSCAELSYTTQHRTVMIIFLSSFRQS